MNYYEDAYFQSILIANGDILTIRSYRTGI